MFSFQNKVPPPIILALLMTGTFIMNDYFLTFHFPFQSLISAVVLLLSSIGAFGMIEFKRQNTTINPISIDTSSCLVTSGIFKYTRNPMYVGLMSIMIAYSFFLGSFIGLLLTLFFGLYLHFFQIKPEEATMRGLFGNDFKTYCEQAPRWLLFF